MCIFISLVHAVRRLGKDHLVLTENCLFSAEVRRQVTSVIKDAQQLDRIKLEKYKEVYVSRQSIGGHRYVLKKQKNPTVSARLKSLTIRSSLRQEYEVYLRLAALKIPAPRAIILGERYSRGLLSESYLVTEWIEGQEVEKAYSELSKNGKASSLHCFLKALAGYTMILWKAGVLHDDLNPGNILVAMPEPSRYQFYLVDVFPCHLIDKDNPLRPVDPYLRSMAVLVAGLWLSQPEMTRPLVYYSAYTLRLLGLNRSARRYAAASLLKYVQHYYKHRVLAKRDRRIYYESERFGIVRLSGMHGYYKKCARGEKAFGCIPRCISSTMHVMIERDRILYALGECLSHIAPHNYVAVIKDHKLTSPDSPWTIANMLYNRSLPVFEPILALEQSGLTHDRLCLIVLATPDGTIVGAPQLQNYFNQMTDDERRRTILSIGTALASSLRRFHQNNCYLTSLSLDSIGLHVEQTIHRVYVLSPYAAYSEQCIDSTVKRNNLKLVIDLCKAISVSVSSDMRHQFLRAYFQRNRSRKFTSRRFANVE